MKSLCLPLSVGSPSLQTSSEILQCSLALKDCYFCLVPTLKAFFRFLVNHVRLSTFMQSKRIDPNGLDDCGVSIPGSEWGCKRIYLMNHERKFLKRDHVSSISEHRP